MMNRPIPLRPHHGMCLAYYVGMGYSEGFNHHMGEMLMRLEQNPPIVLTVSCDAICSACPNNRSGVCTDSDKVMHFDRGVLTACGRKEGDVLPFLEFAQETDRTILSKGRREEICGACQWNSLCQGPGRWAVSR